MAAAPLGPRAPLMLLAMAEEWAARALEAVLIPRGYAIVRARSADQAFDLAYSARPDAIIVDAHLPGGGIELCARLRRDAQMSSGTPIIVTMREGNVRATRAAAYSAGAWEFCTEPLDVETLVSKLDTFVAVKLEGDRIQSVALVEADTGLYTASGLIRRAREIGADATRRRAPVACVAFSPETVPPGEVVTFDSSRVDRSALAMQIGRICRMTTRGSDVLGRMGENDFAIIAVATPEQGAARLAERLRKSTERELAPVTGITKRVQLNIAIAAIENPAESAVDVVELLYRTTSALHRPVTAEHPVLPDRKEDVLSQS